jgi:hypothetical protein
LKTIITNCFFIILSLTHPCLSSAQQSEVPFTATTAPSSSTIFSFNCHKENNRVLLNWSVNKNEAAYQFEIEKSADGIKFSMAALVFGTDKADIDQYRFFEKAQSSKTYYRVKIVYRDQTSRYSDMIQCE